LSGDRGRGPCRMLLPRPRSCPCTQAHTPCRSMAEHTPGRDRLSGLLLRWTTGCSSGRWL
jgi:hypothetical protein